MDKTASVIPHKWKEFGKAVNITPEKLKDIKTIIQTMTGANSVI